MMKRILFPLLFAAAGHLATAQPTRTYEVPKLTDEVRAIRAAAASWAPLKPLEGSLPASVDNSKLKYFPKVFDQKGGSCAQSSGIRYLFTYEMNRLLDRDAQASDANTFSYFYTWNFLNDGIDQGGFAEQGLNIARQQGAMSLADFPDPSSYFTFKWASGYDKYTRAMQNRVKEIISFEVRVSTSPAATFTMPATAAPMAASSPTRRWPPDGPSTRIIRGRRKRDIPTC